MRFFDQPLWLVGFRPFFLLAMVAGIILPPLWAAFLGGGLNPPAELDLLWWHAHEMFYGFGWAILGGFLLTASKNWVQVRGLHGSGLALLSLLWILDRVFVFWPELTPPPVRYLSGFLFLLGCGGTVILTLVSHRKKDTYSDNFFFILLLLLFLPAKWLSVSSDTWREGITLSLGLFRLAFAIMFERTLTQFMKNTEGLGLFRWPPLDFGIKALILLSAFQALLPTALAAAFLFGAGVLLFIRWILWKPWVGLRKFGNAVSYLGYLGLTTHFVAEGGRLLGLHITGPVSIHIFNFLCLGVTAAGMIIRISQGHTGRKAQFVLADRLAMAGLLLAAVFRILFTQILPNHQSLWIQLSAALWSLTFLILLFRFGPFLLAARVDGKVH